VARVEWAALEGGEAETVISNLLYNKYGRAVRVRPGQGDYGIDVLIPATADPEPWDVYQIKKFATNLEPGQKTQIEKSFSRMLIGIVRRGFKVRNWYLVMPLDPTPDNLTWFADLPEQAIKLAKKAKKNPMTSAEEVSARAWLNAPGHQIEWKGLVFCEPLAAEFPNVVDHYLHGGAERLRAAIDSVASLLRGDMSARAATAKPTDGKSEGRAALMEPAEVVEHLKTLDNVLDTDPHYTYGHSVGPNEPIILPEPDLVAATVRRLPNGRFLVFKIYQRSAQSLEERPITIDVTFRFDEGSPEKEAIELWKKFGKPVEAKAIVTIDLPGGLGTEAEEALVKVSPLDQPSQFTNRMRVVDPAGVVLAELTFTGRTTVGEDRTGAWTSSADRSGTIESEGFFDLTAGAQQNLSFTVLPLAGRDAADSAPAVRFASSLHAPNTLHISGPVGPFHTFHALSNLEPLVHPLVDRLVQALAIIQTRTPAVLALPDVSKLTETDLNQILRAGRLIEGATLVQAWTSIQVDGVPKGALEVGGHYQLATYEPLTVTLNAIQHHLGFVQHVLLSARIESVGNGKLHPVPNLNDTAHSTFVEQMPPLSEGSPLGSIPVRGAKIDEMPETPETLEGSNLADPLA
jgi:hypothetical protein